MTRRSKLHPGRHPGAIVAAIAMLSGCAAVTGTSRSEPAVGAVVAAASATQRASADKPERGKAAKRSMALDVYLETIEKLYRGRWVSLIQAADLLPAGLATTISLSLDRYGQLARAWISGRSGYHRFDNSALGIVQRTPMLPAPPPELADSSITLRWRFFRDLRRGCKAAFARVEKNPLSPERAFDRALALHDVPRAAKLVAKHGVRGELGAKLAAAAIARRDLWPQAVRLTADWQLDQLLASDKTERDLWDLSLAELRRRQSRAMIARVLDALTRPRPPWLVGTRAQQRERSRRLMASIRSAARLGYRPTDAMLLRALSSRNPANVLLAADMLRRSAALRQGLRQHLHDARVAGPLAVRLLHRGARDVENIVRDQLGGAGAEPTLRALTRFPDARYAEVIDSIARDAKAKPTLRAAALGALAAMQRKVVTLYSGLRSKEVIVRRAAARALRKHHGNKLAASYKLAELCYPAKDPVSAEALATMAVINHERFVWDILRVLRRLDRDPSGQALVVKQLWRFGNKVVTTLAALAKRKHPALREALAETLAKIGSSRARALLATLEPVSSPPPAPAPRVAKPQPQPRDAFALLVIDAAGRARAAK
ncbi:MAG: TonB family protein [Myxococcales bacterium]|nr:TonB family protein [Myxococcales bacterium]